jgi:hypothetical protein
LVGREPLGSALEGEGACITNKSNKTRQHSRPRQSPIYPHHVQTAHNPMTFGRHKNRLGNSRDRVISGDEAAVGVNRRLGDPPHGVSPTTKRSSSVALFSLPPRASRRPPSGKLYVYGHRRKITILSTIKSAAIEPGPRSSRAPPRSFTLLRRPRPTGIPQRCPHSARAPH